MAFLYVTSLFLSAWLLFGVQPMIARRLLPELGGAPIVWNTCLVCFQSMLLGGYCYAHIVTHRVRRQRQRPLHLLLLALPILLFVAAAFKYGHPLAAPSGLTSWVRQSTFPIAGPAVMLVAMVGLPFFMLSSSAPLLQHWYWQSDPRQSGNPYPLYRASNLGSLVALLGYPLLERQLELPQQQWLWSAGYLVLFLLTTFCVWTTRASFARPSHTRKRHDDGRDVRRRAVYSDTAVIHAARRWRWLALAAGPSSLLMSVTNYITTDVAAVPLAWVIPLAIYLVTFILAFGRRQWIPHRLVIRYFPLVLIIWSFTLTTGATEPAPVLFGVHLVAFFVASLACHGELYRDRPPPAQLTSFYLCVSLGGVLGSIFTALIAPLIFNALFEYPLIMLASFVVCSPQPDSERAQRSPGSKHAANAVSLGTDIGLAIAVGAFVLISALAFDKAGGTAAKILESMGLRYLWGTTRALPLICLGFWSRRRPLRFSLGIGGILVGIYLAAPTGRVIHAERTWFGIHRVTWDEECRFHQLVHGNTVHGRQQWPSVPDAPPGSYYHPTGPLGDVFAIQNTRGAFRHVAVAGLGAGCTAYYGRDQADQQWTFFEIDPAVVRIASDPHYFNFLRDAFPDSSRLSIVMGDARLKLAETPDASFDLIVLDAFSSDAIPVHLLTREALAVYMRTLTARGLLVYHISNRHLGLHGLLASLAKNHDPPLACYNCDDLVNAQTPEEERDGKTASQWVVLARHVSHLGSLAEPASRWQRPIATVHVPPWTDNHVDILSVWKRH